MATTGLLSRGLLILQTLVGEQAGLPLGVIADRTGISKATTHRVLANLQDDGYVRQEAETGTYHLSLRIISMALRHLAEGSVVELAQPVLDELAASSRELVRLSLVDEDELVWVAKAQGATSGLRYDPDTGASVRLSCSASGFTWLSQLPEEVAIKLALDQGLGTRERYGPRAPTSVEELLKEIRLAKARGYGVVDEAFELGTAAIAVPVRGKIGQAPIGVLSIAGPSIRLTEKRREELVEPLLEASERLSGLSFK